MDFDQIFFLYGKLLFQASRRALSLDELRFKRVLEQELVVHLCIYWGSLVDDYHNNEDPWQRALLFNVTALARVYNSLPCDTCFG